MMMTTTATKTMMVTTVTKMTWMDYRTRSSNDNSRPVFCLFRKPPCFLILKEESVWQQGPWWFRRMWATLRMDLCGAERVPEASLLQWKEQACQENLAMSRYLCEWGGGMDVIENVTYFLFLGLGNKDGAPFLLKPVLYHVRRRWSSLQYIPLYHHHLYLS